MASREIRRKEYFIYLRVSAFKILQIKKKGGRGNLTLEWRGPKCQAGFRF